MNRYKEAKAWIDKINAHPEWARCDFEEPALSQLTELVEKATPKKPDYEGDGYDDNGELIYDTWICPCCEKHYEVDYDDYDYCPNCGQALDWEIEVQEDEE